MSRFLFLTVSFFVGLSALPAGAQSLSDSVARTLREHPSIEAAQARLNFTSQDVREQKSGYYPDLSVSASAGRVFANNSTSRGLSVTRDSAFSFFGEGSATLRQPLLGLLRTEKFVDAAKMRAEAAQINVQDARETLALRAAQSYIEMLRAEEGHQLIINQIRIVQDYVERIEAGVEDGVNNEAELQQAKDVIVVLKTLRDDYDAQKDAALAGYIEIFGQEPDEGLFKPKKPTVEVPVALEDAVALAKLNSAAYSAAKSQAKALVYELEGERLGVLPDVDGELSYLQSDRDEDIGGEVTDARALLRLNWNFETGGAHSARVKKKKFEHIETIARVKELSRQLDRDVRLAYAEHKNAHNQHHHSLKRRDLAQELFKTQDTQFEASLVSLLQLLQTQNQLLTARLEAVNAEYRLMGARYAVLANLGVLRDELLNSSSASGDHSQ